MITINNLTKNYGGYQLKLSMEIPEGCITGLIGKNGAGKSTTIKSILGLICPDGGSVKVFGKEASALAIKDKERIGVALSDSGFSSYLTVADVAKVLDKMYAKCKEETFLAMCRKQGLPTDKLIREFSTGMKAKLRVLVALSHEADLLIMDEPTTGLDVEARNEILDILRNYLTENEHRSILITSHIATDLEGLCDDVYLIHDGHVLLHEETDIILSQYGILKVDDEAYEKLDRKYVFRTRKESFGYSCLTKEKQYYQDNYPGMVVEKIGIDELILMMTGGK